jgi:CBS domain containing-hemolysin-like protein
MTVTLAVLLGLAVILSAFFTTAELALFSVGESRVRALADEGVRGSGALAHLRTRPERILVLLRLCDTFADVSAGAIVAWAFWLQGEAAGIAIALGLVAVLILYVGELIPIGLAANHGLPFALALAPVLLPLARVLGPLLGAVSRLARIRPETRASGSTGVTETEIRQLTALGHTEGSIEAHERELIERAFRLDETQVWDVMTPRVDIFAWADDLLLRDLVPQLGTVRYSRVPVYHDTIDNITGVLYLRDAYQALVSGQRDVPLLSLAREPLLVAGSVSVTKLLRDFQNRRIHLAVVVDEYGGTDGLVTLEDAIEELVGEIVDERDVAEEAITRVSRGEILVNGDADLREINHFFNTAFPLLEHRTFNGYLLEELDRVPERGEKLEREGVAIEILEATDTQVTRARLRRMVSEEAGAHGEARAREGASRQVAAGAPISPPGGPA